jgi:hypothetical protein
LDALPSQKQFAWDAVMQQAQSLQPEFDYAVQHDATIETRYPEMTRFLRGKQAIAQRANQTKSAKAKAKKAAENPPAATPPAGPAPSPPAAAKA